MRLLAARAELGDAAPLQCDDLLLPEPAIYLPALSGEGPFSSCYCQPQPCLEEDAKRPDPREDRERS